MFMIALWRRAAAELTGTAALVTTVVGSGIMAQRLSSDGAVQLLANSAATVLGLAVLIAVLEPISGAHFNPVVSLADWWLGREQTGTGLRLAEVGVYSVAQIAGAVGGAIVANLMFGLTAVSLSHTVRAGNHLWFAEVVATTGLVVVIVGLVRSGRAAVIPAAVGAYIGAAYWFTSSTSFANPAVTIGRAFTDTYAGIAPASVPGFVAAQGAGLLAALGLIALLYPARDSKTANVTPMPDAQERQAEHV
jgi:glycerol uptake facilitator-like aquaporin